MAKISRWPVDPKDMGIFIDNFWNLLTLLKSKDEVKVFLKDLLTHTETKMFAKRLEVASMLLANYSYQQIRAEVHVTDNTIAKISNILATNGQGLKIAIKRLDDLVDKRMKAKKPKRTRVPGDIVTPLTELGIEKIGQALHKRGRRKSVEKSLV